MYSCLYRSLNCTHIFIYLAIYLACTYSLVQDLLNDLVLSVSIRNEVYLPRRTSGRCDRLSFEVDQAILAGRRGTWTITLGGGDWLCQRSEVLSVVLIWLSWRHIRARISRRTSVCAISSICLSRSSTKPPTSNLVKPALNGCPISTPTAINPR